MISLDTPLHTLALACSIIFLGLLIYLSQTESARLEKTLAAYHGAEIENGARLYQENCRSCHGIKGEGVGQLGPDIQEAHFFTRRLSEVGWNGTLKEYIASSTSYGRMMGTRQMYAGNGATAVMPPWSQGNGGPLREDEIEALTSFILNWHGTATGEVVFTPLELPQSNPNDPQVIEAGKTVFAKSCSSCHQYGQEYPEPGSGPDLTPLKSKLLERESSLDLGEYIRESILLPMAVVAPEFYDEAAINPCGAVLSETEMTTITAYLSQ